MASECWQQLVLQSGRSRLAWEEGYTSFNSVATIQIVPRLGTGLFFMPLLCTAFVFPLCLCPSFLPRYCKTPFQPEVSIRFWHDALMPRFVWPREDVGPGASLSGSCAACRISFSCCHKGTSRSHLSKASFVFGDGDAGL